MKIRSMTEYAIPRMSGLESHLPRESPKKFSKFQKFIHKKKINFYSPPPEPADGKKTLVLDMDETLLHSSPIPPHPSVKYFTINKPLPNSTSSANDNSSKEINYNEGEVQSNETCNEDFLYIYKRPGLDEFLEYALERFEIFIYTFAERNYAEQILDKIFGEQLDEDHRLYRDSCVFNKKAKVVVKDLEMLRRQKNKMIFVDDNDEALKSKFNKENTIVIPMWKGVPSDRALCDWLKPLLERCIEAEDVREVIRTVENRVRRFTV